jgi:NAD(P)-dependent dehydrogenase (short-subunit alcohol dehydrogenase family)
MALGMTDTMQGQVAIVTGGGGGIGRAVGRALAQAGVRVALADLHLPAAEEAARTLAESGHEVCALLADVADRHAVQSMAEAVLARWGRIDILVNNAGISITRPLLEMTEDEWQRVLRVNLTGPFLCSQTVAAHMIARRYGRIVNIASTAAQFGAPGLAAYASSKSALLGLTRVSAIEWAPYGIAVNAVCPGNTDTEMLQEVLARRAAALGKPVEEVIAGILSKTPAGRFGDPAEVAAVVAFLASPAAGYVNGQALTVCGGRTILLA